MKTPEQENKARIKRLVRRDKFVEAYKTVMFILTILAILISLMLSQKQFIPEAQGQVIEHTVQAGENLTSIANKYSDEYVLKAVADIRKLNNMTESDIQVGQVLRIEVK